MVDANFVAYEIWKDGKRDSNPLTYQDLTVADCADGYEARPLVYASELERVRRERDEFRDIAARKSNQVAGLIRTENAERLAGARVDRVLDVAGDYMFSQYGNSALHHPTDRARIKDAITALADHPRDTNPVVSHETANVRDIEPIPSGLYGEHTPVVARTSTDALAEPAGEAEPDGALLSVKAWRIKKGCAVPQWLQATDNVDLRAGCDLVVLEAKEGFDVYRADPGSFVQMMVGDAIDKSKPTKIRGAPTNLMAGWAANERIKKAIAKGLDGFTVDNGTVAAFDRAVDGIHSAIRAALAGSAE